MLPDFTIVNRHFNARDDIVIYPIADVHLAAPEHMEKEFSEFIGKVKGEPNSYLVLGGDLVNNGVKSSVSNVYQERYMPGESKRMMAKLLEPVRDKILCAVQGNHEARNKDVDDDPMYDIMAKLDIEDLYRENAAFLHLQFGDRENRGKANPSYTIVVTHGAGGGILTGGAVNRAERFGYAIDGADMIITGHTHKTYDSCPHKVVIDVRNNTVSQKPFFVVSCSPWMRYGGYALRKMLLPGGHVPQKIKLHGMKKQIQIITG